MSNLSVNNLNISGNITTSGTVTAGNISTSGTLSYAQLTIDTYPAGTIIEKLTSICDGSTVTGASGTFTWPEVTAGWTDGNNTNTLITTPGYEGYNNQHHPNYWGVYTNAMTTPQHYYFMYFDKPGTTNELRYCIAFGSSTNATGARFLLNDNDVGSPAQGNEQGVSIIKISEIYQKS